MCVRGDIHVATNGVFSIVLLGDRDEWWSATAGLSFSVECATLQSSSHVASILLNNVLFRRPPNAERTVRRLRLSKALTLPDSTTVADACRRMANRRVDSCLLTDSSALLCGIITDKVRFELGNDRCVASDHRRTRTLLVVFSPA